MAALMKLPVSPSFAWFMAVLVGTFAPTAAQAQCGGRWLPLGTGVNGGWVFALAVLPDGQLAAGGSFTSAGAVTGSSIARWSGIAWLPMGSGFDVQSLVIHPDGDLIAAAYFDPANEILGPIARFDGRGWSQIGTTYEPGTVQELAVLANGDLIASGYLWTGGANHIARWDGAAWSGLGAGLSGVASAMAVLQNGDGTTSGDDLAIVLAAWGACS